MVPGGAREVDPEARSLERPGPGSRVAPMKVAPGDRPRRSIQKIDPEDRRARLESPQGRAIRRSGTHTGSVRRRIDWHGPVEREVARPLKAELLISAPSECLDAPPDRGAPGFRAFGVPGFRGPARRSDVAKRTNEHREGAENGPVKSHERQIMPGAYALEVSSPGIDRPIRTPDDFRRNIGRVLAVTAMHSSGERRSYHGKLLGCDGAQLRLAGDTEKEIRIPLEEVVTARQHVTF